MDKELQTYYEERFNTTSTKGWADIIADAQSMYDVYSQVKNIKDVDSLKYVQGQLDILEWILTLRDVSKEAYTQLQEEDNG